MTDDELKALVESNARAIAALSSTTATALQQTNATLDRTAQQQATNATSIDDLLGVVVAHEAEIQQVVSAIEESNRRFDILREEAIADRQRSDERFDRMLLEIRGVAGRVETLEQAS
ncbi:MAG: hypothetical protein WBA76_10375 [Phormidesmis sp.]